tara:strand:- start:6290 stop:6412 length:123 start_codon:yes stop_codon:yes gene_type:complete
VDQGLVKTLILTVGNTGEILGKMFNIIESGARIIKRAING